MHYSIMLLCIMKFVNRTEELSRLDRLAAGAEGGLAVVYGRRRVGKTRLLLEWSERHGGLYTVADQSAADIQRRYFAESVATRLQGFAEVEYRDWRALLTRLAREAEAGNWRGPVVFDELPYLVTSSPELPSVLQRWIDHEARAAKLVVAVAGSSQRMMQGLVLSRDAPLYGRAREILELRPLEPARLWDVFRVTNGVDLVGCYAAWGGIPRYWELAAGVEGPLHARIDDLVLDPLGPLHHEPDRILIEEIPSALEVRPVLDALGAGSHRVSEIASRIGRPATSMSRPLERLVGMGLARREVPFGESEKKSKRTLYRIEDPFFRLWFRVVAPRRAQLAAATRRDRLSLLRRHWDSLASQAWEDLCRTRLPLLRRGSGPAGPGPWKPGSRWWKASLPEWDVLSESQEGKRLLLGEAKWKGRPFRKRELERALRELALKPAPPLPREYARHEEIRVLFVPDYEGPAPSSAGALVVTAADLTR